MLKRAHPKFLLLTLFLYIFSPGTLAHASIKAEVQALRYEIEPALDSPKPSFRIDLTFKGDTSGTTNLILPNRWGGQSNLHNTVRDLQVISPQVTISNTTQPHIKSIAHKPEQSLQIRYYVVQDYEGNPRNQNRYRPLVQNEYFHWIGHGVWVYPSWTEDDPVSVSLEWNNLPKQWTIANSFGAREAQQCFTSTIGALKHAIFTGGDFNISTGAVEGKPIHTLHRGVWNFSASDFGNMVHRIIEVERAFWKDFDVPYYLVTLIPIDALPGNTSIGGTGLTNSFALFATRNINIDDLKALIAHEYFHNWNAQKLGRIKEPEQQLYWFSEGFTDYYAYLLLLRSGLLTLEEYLQKFNSLIYEYYFLPVRNETNQRVIKDFWTNSDVQKLPYRRGLLLAANWNALIRKATNNKHSLDDVMLELLQASQKGKRELSAVVINDHLRRYVGRDLLPEMLRYIDQGELIVPDRGAFGPHLSLKIEEFAQFELGLDLEMLVVNKVISGVKEDSAAYRAGLRDDQVFLRRLPIYVGDPKKPVEITIQDGEEERTIKYFPASDQRVSVPQYRLPIGMTDEQRTATLRWLGASL